MDFTCVEIKNVKYIKLIPLDKKSARELDLTTIYKDQEQAFLNIYYVDKNKKKTLLKSIEINNIRPGKSGIPELHLSVSYDGRQYYKIILKLNGFIYHNSVIDIKQVRKTPFSFINIALLTLVLLILSFFTFFTLKAIRNPGGESMTVKSQPVSEESKSMVSTQSESSQPEADQTETSQSETTQTEITQSETTQSETTQSETSQSETSRSESSQSESSQSESSQSESSQSESSQSESSQSEASQSEASQSEASEASEADYDQSEPQTIEVSELVENHAVVYFYPNSSVLTPDAKSVLRQILDILNNNNNLDVEILGHCAYYGTEKGRQEISTERAENVYSYFITNGWTPESKPLIAGLGLKQIVTRDPEKQNLNRRVEINIKTKKEEN